MTLLGNIKLEPQWSTLSEDWLRDSRSDFHGNADPLSELGGATQRLHHMAERTCYLVATQKQRQRLAYQSCL